MGDGGVHRIEVTERERPVFGGTEFGGIVNLDKAARNARGNVEYHSDFRILKAFRGCVGSSSPNSVPCSRS
jgi:hypothetical protein